MPFASPNREPVRSTTAEEVMHRLMLDIVAGTLPPGFKLRVEALKQRYDVGGSPLREALSALAASGFVTLESRRGFKVPELSREDIYDITRVRTMVEVEALALSLQNGDEEWESGIVAAYHRYTRFAARHAEGSSEVDLRIEQEHKAFHTALVAACGSPRLIALQASLYDQALRYRLAHRRKPVDVDRWIKEHAELMDAVISRDIPRATAAMRQHMLSTPRAVYDEAPVQPQRVTPLRSVTG